jgi:hypothetical protein
MIALDELGTTKTRVAEGVLKSISDTTVKIPRKPTECARVLALGPSL